MSEIAKRRQRYNALQQAGSERREAGIATFPELTPDTAAVQMDGVVEPGLVDVDAAPGGKVSSLWAHEQFVTRLTDMGIDPTTAKSHADETFAAAPDSITMVDYDRLDSFLSDVRNDLAAGATEQALSSGQVMKDIEFIGTSLGAVFGSVQQGWFSALIGEQVSDTVARLWPSADIRDDEGTLQSKAVVPMAIKGMTLGFAGQVLDVMSFGTGGLALKTEARQVAQELMETDYRDDLLTGQEVLEYWMNGDGLVDLDQNGQAVGRSSLPAVGTPERAEYDKHVRANAAQNYALKSDQRWGNVSMAGIALTGALGDIFADPALFISGTPSKGIDVARRIGSTSSKARITGGIAEKSRRYTDVLNAVEDATRWVDEAAETYKAKQNPTNKVRLDHAQKHMVKLQSRLDAFESAPGEAVMFPTTPRIRPDQIKPIGKLFLDTPKKTRAAVTRRFIQGEVRASVKNVRKLEKQLQRLEGGGLDKQDPLFTPEQLGADVDKLKTSINDARAHRDSWKETMKWFNNRMKNPASRTAAFFKENISKMQPYESTELTFRAGAKRTTKLKKIQENIKRGIAQGAPEEEIIQWERAYTRVSNKEDAAIGGVTRPTDTTADIVGSAIDAQRRKILGEIPDPAADMTKLEGQQLSQRAAVGPDQTEAAGEAARVLAAGGEIDDIAYHGTGIDVYNSSYGTRLRPGSGTESRAVEAVMQRELASEVEWLGRDPFRTTVEVAEWQQTVGEKLSDVWMRGLYPRSWNMRPAGMLQNIREPMRVLQSVNPRLYTRVHNAVRAQEFELARMTDVFSRELQLLGVYKESKGSMVLDSTMSERFYKVMNMDPSSNKYNQALSALSETERRSIRRIRQELDFMADKLGLRGSDRFIEGYIDHVFDARWSAEGARAMEARGLGANAEIFNPYLIERQGKAGYVPDLALALDSYVRASTRKLHLEPLFKDMQASAKQHLLNNPGDVWFSQYVNHMINNFKGKPTTLGQWVDINMAAMNARMRARDSVMGTARGVGKAVERAGGPVEAAGRVLSKAPGKLGRFGGALQSEGVRLTEFGSEMSMKGMPVYVSGDASRTAMGVTALAYSSVLGGSGRYFPMAVATGLATTGSRYGIFGTLRGVLTMATPEGRVLAKQVGLEKQWVQIMEDAAWTKIGKLAANMPSFNGVTAVGPSITATENMIRGWTFHATLGDLMRKQGFTNWDEAVEAGVGNAMLHEGLRVTEEVNHLFGQLGKPPTFNRFSKSGSAGMTQFLSFIPKQMEELLAQSMDNVGRIGQYMMVSGYIQRVAAKAGLDISDYVGAGFLPNSPDEATSITFELLTNMFTSANEMSKLVTGTGNPQATKIANAKLVRSLQNYIPTAMATQRAGRAYETLRTGRLFSDKELVREVDLGEFEWDDTKSVAANLANLPKGLMSTTGDPAQATELAATLTGLNSTQATLERQQYQAMRTAAQNHVFRRGEIARALKEARDKGDTAAFERHMQKAFDEGMLPPDISRMVEQASIEAVVPRLMREQLRTDQGMIDSIDIMMRTHALYDARFNQ